MGLISDDGIYYIQPYHNGNVTNNDTSVRHIMYRHQDRIVASENNSHCAVKTKGRTNTWYSTFSIVLMLLIIFIQFKDDTIAS